MNTAFLKIVISAAATLVLLIGAGCESSDGYSGSTSVSVGYYGGSGWYDPYYNRRYYGTVVVPPRYPNRPGHRPPGHRPPGARPPGGPSARPLPSRPRPQPRRGGGGRGRR
jgi:hypothetical protein